MSSRATGRLTAMDGWLLLMVAIWGGNYSLVKAVFAEIPAIPFNALRLSIASSLFLAVIARERRRGSVPPLERRDWLTVAGLGVVGHFLYQSCFIGGISLTSVANSALILGCTPVATALLAGALGHERVTRAHWGAALLSVAGLYLVAARGVRLSGESLTGDLVLVVAIACWTVYTVFSRPLLARHSPLVITGYSMAIGTALFVPAATPALLRHDWSRVSAGSWLAVAASAVLALNVSYLIWYTAVQRLGNTRTSLYSNMVPVAALGVAWLTLGERIDAPKLTGATMILAGVLVSRFAGPRPGLPADPPAEE